MANPTTNYGFVLPTSSDLVTDLPADFDVALQGVDTRLKALNPGTTLGDIDYSSATANTNTRLAIGSTGANLTVVGGVPAWVATPTFYAYLSANQTVTAGVITKVQCNTEEYDLGANYDNATNYRFTPTTAGIYQVNAVVNGSGSGGTTIWIYKNGSAIREGARTAGAGAPMGFSTQITMNGSSDYIEFFAQVSGGTTVYGGQSVTGFGAAFLRTN